MVETSRHPLWENVIRNLDRRKDIFEKLRFQDGMSLEAIASQMGVSVSTLRTWIKRNNIPRKPKVVEPENKEGNSE